MIWHGRESFDTLEDLVDVSDYLDQIYATQAKVILSMMIF
jgi:hypothetical protein